MEERHNAAAFGCFGKIAETFKKRTESLKKEITNKESVMSNDAHTEYTAIKAELNEAREALTVILKAIDELHTRFISIDYDEDSDDEKEEIEERIAKLEDALEELDDDDTKAAIQKKIDVLNSQLSTVDDAGELHDELKELFSDIADDLHDVDLETD